MGIKVKTTYVTRRAITFYEQTWLGNGTCHLDNKKPTRLLSSGTMVCVGMLGGKPNCAMMTTPVHGNPMFAWIDESDLCPKELAESEGLQPHFA